MTLAQQDTSVPEAPAEPPKAPTGVQLWPGGPLVTPEQVVGYARNRCEFCGGKGVVSGRRLNPRTRAMEKIVNEVCGCAIDRFKEAHGAAGTPAEFPEGAEQPDDDIEQDNPTASAASVREKYTDLIKRADADLVAALERQNIKEGPCRAALAEAKEAHQAKVNEHEARELEVLRLEAKAVELFAEAESMAETVARIKKEAQEASRAATVKRREVSQADTASLEAARRHMEKCERDLEKMTKAERPEIRKLTKQIERWKKKLERTNGESR